MKKGMAMVLVMAAVILTAGLAMAGAADSVGLTEYRVVNNTSVSLAEVVDLFVPSLSGGAKFLPPKANGLGLIHWWNPQLAGATWKTSLQPGDTLRLPAEWVLRGVQGVLEPVNVPQLNPVTGGESWLYVIVIGVCTGLIYTYVSGRLFHRRPCQPWRRI